jgi:hypothetical protein
MRNSTRPKILLDQAGLGGLLGDWDQLWSGLGHGSRLGSVGNRRARLFQEFAGTWSTLGSSLLGVGGLCNGVRIGVGGSLRQRGVGLGRRRSSSDLGLGLRDGGDSRLGRGRELDSNGLFVLLLVSLGSSLVETRTHLARGTVVPLHEIVDRHDGNRRRIGMSDLTKWHVVHACLTDLFGSPVGADVGLARDAGREELRSDDHPRGAARQS